MTTYNITIVLTAGAKAHKVSQSISILLARNHVRLVVRHVVVKIVVYGLVVGRMRRECGRARVSGVMVINMGGKR